MTDNPTATNDRTAGGDPGAFHVSASRVVDRRRAPRNVAVKLDRDPAAVAGGAFDLVVVGGGLFGAWAAYDAAQRGLSVALLEQDDFGAGVSAHALRLAHARPPADVWAPLELRRRAVERGVLMALAPHLVQPLAVLAPRYGGGRRALPGLAARLAVRTAAKLGVGRRLYDPDRRDRWVGILTAGRLRRALPDLPRLELAGADWWPALQVVCPERLVLAVIQSAVCRGARVLNHARVEALEYESGVVTGVGVSDPLADTRFSVRAGVVLNATGTYLGDSRIDPVSVGGGAELALMTGRRLVSSGRALALPGTEAGPGLVVAPSGNGGSVIGPWPLPEGVETADAAAACLERINQVCPAWQLRIGDVDCLSVSQRPPARPDGRAADVIDHASRDGVGGLVSVVGRRYASAHTAAAEAVDRALAKLGLPETASRSSWVPLVGGDLPTVRKLSDEMARVLERAPEDGTGWGAMDGLRRRQGALAPALVRAAIDAGACLPVAQAGVLEAELIHAAKSEAALTLSDAVLRRIGLAAWGTFSDEVLHAAADTMASARGWTDAERERQLRELRAALAEHLPSASLESAAPAGSAASPLRAADPAAERSD